MTSREQKKFDLLIGFVNDICEVVSNPEEHLDFNTKDSSIYSIGYSLDKNNEPVIETIDCDKSINALKGTLSEILDMVRSYSKVDYSEKWEELR